MQEGRVLQCYPVWFLFLNPSPHQEAARAFEAYPPGSHGEGSKTESQFLAFLVSK